MLQELNKNGLKTKPNHQLYFIQLTRAESLFPFITQCVTILAHQMMAVGGI